MNYLVNDRTGEVHADNCPRVKVIHSKSPWDPAKAALTPGVYADKICLPAGLPLRAVERFSWVDEEEVQRLAWIRDQFCDCPGMGLDDDQHSPDGCHGLEVAAAVRRANAGRWEMGTGWFPGPEDG